MLIQWSKETRHINSKLLTHILRVTSVMHNAWSQGFQFSLTRMYRARFSWNVKQLCNSNVVIRKISVIFLPLLVIPETAEMRGTGETQMINSLPGNRLLFKSICCGILNERLQSFITILGKNELIYHLTCGIGFPDCLWKGLKLTGLFRDI